jgi:hypothetical protein
METEHEAQEMFEDNLNWSDTEDIEDSYLIQTTMKKQDTVRRELRSFCDHLAELDEADLENFMPEDLNDADVSLGGALTKLEGRVDWKDAKVGQVSAAVRALNGPMEVAIRAQFSHELASNVIVLCAGDGREIDYIQSVYPSICGSLLVHTVDPPRSELKERADKWKGPVQFVQAFDIEDLLCKMPNHRYQVIVANLTLNQALGSEHDRKRLPELLHRHLTMDGVLLGTAYDLATLTEDEARGQVNDILRVRQILPADRRFPQGRVRLEVCGEECIDPVVGMDTYYRSLEDFYVEVVPADVLLLSKGGMPATHPPGLVIDDNIDTLLHKIWYVEVRKVPERIPQFEWLHNYHNPTPQWEEVYTQWDTRVENELMLEKYCPEPLKPEDIQQLRGRHALFTNMDGGAIAWLLIDRGTSYLKVWGGRRFQNTTNGVTRPLRVRAVCSVTDAGLPTMNVSIIEVVSKTLYSPLTFLARDRMMHMILHRYPLLSTHVSLRKWTRHPGDWQHAAVGAYVQDGMATWGGWNTAVKACQREYTARFVMTQAHYDSAIIARENAVAHVMRDMDYPVLVRAGGLMALTRDRIDKLRDELAAGTGKKIHVDMTMDGWIKGVNTDTYVDTIHEIEVKRRAITLPRLVDFFELAGHQEVDINKIPRFMRILREFCEKRESDKRVPAGEFVHIWTSSLSTPGGLSPKQNYYFREMREAVLEAMRWENVMRIIVRDGHPMVVCMLDDGDGLLLELFHKDDIEKGEYFDDVRFAQVESFTTSGEAVSRMSHPMLHQWLTKRESKQAALAAMTVIVIDPGPPGRCVSFVRLKGGGLYLDLK